MYSGYVWSQTGCQRSIYNPVTGSTVHVQKFLEKNGSESNRTILNCQWDISQSCWQIPMKSSRWINSETRDYGITFGSDPRHIPDAGYGWYTRIIATTVSAIAFPLKNVRVDKLLGQDTREWLRELDLRIRTACDIAGSPARVGRFFVVSETMRSTECPSGFRCVRVYVVVSSHRRRLSMR